MKSFEPFYALLAAYMPVSVMVAFLSLAALILEMFTGPLPLGYWFTFSLISAVSASVYWALVKRSKANHSPANVRGAIIIVIVSYLFGSLFHFERTFTARFMPSLYNIPSAIAALAVWFPVVVIKRIFSGQELFESHTQLYEGEKLRQMLLEDSSLMSEHDASMKKLSFRYAILFLPCIILLFVAGGLGLTFTAQHTLLLTAIFIMAACITGFLGFLRREYSFASEGLNLTSRPKNVVAVLIVVLSACTIGLLFSSDKSFLPPSILADLLRRIADFFQGLAREPQDYAPPVMPRQQGPQGMGIPQELLDSLGEAQPSPFWDYVKYAAIAAAAILFIWFMINPLLNRSKLFRGLKGLPKKTLVFLKEWFKTLIKGAVYFFRTLKEGSGGRKMASPSAAALRRLEDDILEGYSPAKRRELRRSIGLFARLIYWGMEVIKVKWKPSHAPLEYCRMLAETSQTPSVIRAGELFEKALYSLNPLSRNERDEFQKLVETITASNPLS